MTARNYDHSTTHGHSKGGKHSPTYSSWRSMLNRCTNPKTIEFNIYGGRGIKVCERWKDFANFLADMGERPPETTIDRIDVNGNYEPRNCRWATWSQQRRNREDARPREAFGRKQLLVDWAREFGIVENLVRCRLVRGWSLERALTVPPDAARQAGRRAAHQRLRRST